MVELGIVLWLLMGWQFTAAEWIGGILMIALMTLLVKLTYPAALVEEARRHVDTAGGHDHGSMEAAGGSWLTRLRDPATRVAIAQNAVMDASMLWKDLLAGFLIAGVLGAVIPDGAWRMLFASGAPPAVVLVSNALLGPLLAVFTFVCSIGNVPLAAILWGSGLSFGGVIAFLYGDLIVLPLLDVYRRYYGTRMMLYIFAVFFVTMAGAAMLMDLSFGALHLVPPPNPSVRHDLMRFSFDHTFWLNLIFGALAVYLWRLDAGHPMNHDHHHHDHDEEEQSSSEAFSPV